ncbi:glycoside hydrolase family 78 protein [Puia sp.]|jgi:alpha-L-rhamnosidase|uniref:glycoside hydrolase family 78 protein n=1 Tax=Puia sp. TaxID=2045100 RepID=UPI002F3F301D
MKKWIGHIALLFATLTTTAAQPTALRCEQLTDPLGIDTRHPRLSWQLTADANDIRQTAWQIIVASTPELLAKDKGDCWTSAKTESDQSRMIAYAGTPLKSGHNYYWKVKAWTNTGAATWSTPAHWSMGLLEAGDWKAKWIGYDNGFPWDSVSKFSRLSARYFRKEFKEPSPIKRATLYIAGLGHYLVAINGQPVGDQVLAESPTDYTKSVKYNSFDVTAALRAGANAIGVTLGNGRFFTMRPKYKPQKIKEFGFPKLLLQLDVEDNKGHHRTIVSDDSWRFTADGPIRTNNEYDGEEYDATKEFPGWTNPGFDDSRWLKPQYSPPPGGRLSAQMNEPIRVMMTVTPVSIKPLNASTYILDMGQNMAGWLQLTARGSRGRKIVLRFAETLQPDGDLYTANLRDAKATDSYTLKGEGEETWHPVFVFHGFRYVSITGYPGTPDPKDFEGQVVYDDLPTIGHIETSDTLLNHIIKNAWWGINANYKGMPVDCPQRNERMPWLGDRATGSLGESYLFANENLYAKWLEDIEESQKPTGSLPDVAPAYWNYYSDNMTWPGTYILIADMLYNQFGDSRPIQKHYASMQRWLHYMSARYEHDGIMTKDKYGDWCVPPESPHLIHSKDSLRNTDGTLIATAYYYHLLTLMEKFAGLLHQPDTFSKHAAAARTAFNKQFLKPGHYSNNSVTANLLPLTFGITPDQQRAAIVRQLINRIGQDNDHISTGVIGTQWLMRGLTEFDHPDLALQIATNKDYPSWGYMVEHGATTIWELWNGNTADPSMNSQNHIMLLGDLLTWCFEDLAGIAPAEPGFKTVRMHPAFPKNLNFVKASYESPYGLIKSEWRRDGDTITWDVTIPPNTHAIVNNTRINSGTYHYTLKTDKSI